MQTRERELLTTMVEFADTLVSSFDLHDYLDMLLARTADVVSAQAGGVMLSDERGHLNLLVSIDERVRFMELVELQRQEGPCVETFRTGAQVMESDLAESPRWPHLAAMAVDAGYRSVFAFPLRLRGDVVGALNLFREQPGPVDADDLGVTQAFADMATIGILQERAISQARDLAGNLQHALHSRVVIEQAKGILAEKANLSMAGAFQLLRLHGRNHNLPLRHVATQITTGALRVVDRRTSQAAPPVWQLVGPKPPA